MQCIKSFAKLPFWVFTKAEIFSFVGCLNKIPIIIRCNIILNKTIKVSSKILDSNDDVGGQRFPDSVRNNRAVSVGQNKVQIWNPNTRKPCRQPISDLDWDSPLSRSGQRCPPTSAQKRTVKKDLPTFKTKIYLVLILKTYLHTWS